MNTCCLCGHKWKSIDGATAKQVMLASKINGQGPFCNLCYHLEMASRYAEARGFKSMNAAVEAWHEAGAKFLDAIP